MLSRMPVPDSRSLRRTEEQGWPTRLVRFLGAVLLTVGVCAVPVAIALTVVVGLPGLLVSLVARMAMYRGWALLMRPTNPWSPSPTVRRVLHEARRRRRA